MVDSTVTFTPNLHLTKLPANYRVWAQIMNDNLTLIDASIDGFVQYNSLRGAWLNSTHYLVGDTIVDPLTAVLHTAQVEHTSAQIPTTFAEDALANPTYWTLANAPASNRGVWTGPGTAYNVNDFVLANGLTYAMCTIQHVSGATFDADLILGRWAVLIDLSIAGSQVLPILSGPIDAQKFVNTNPAGSAYEIVNGTTAMARLEGVLPVIKGGTGVSTAIGIPGSVVLSQSPTITTPTFNGTSTFTGDLNGATAAFSQTVTMRGGAISSPSLPVLLINSTDANSWKGYISFQHSTVPKWQIGVDFNDNAGTPMYIYDSISGIVRVQFTTTGMTLTGALDATSATMSAAIPALSNDTTVATTAWVKANAGSSTTVGIVPPGSPTDGQMWFNNDAAIGGGQLYIRYNDGSSTAWIPAAPGAGVTGVLQTASFQTGAVATGTTVLPIDDTIPQITEGNEYMTLAITPKSATSKLVISVIWVGTASVDQPMGVALFRDAVADALAATMSDSYVNSILTIPLTHTMTSGTTSAITFRVRAGGPNAGTTTFNGQIGARRYGGVMASSIVIQEVL